jgi:hypothetical protein
MNPASNSSCSVPLLWIGWKCKPSILGLPAMCLPASWAFDGHFDVG